MIEIKVQYKIWDTVKHIVSKKDLYTHCIKTIRTHDLMQEVYYTVENELYHRLDNEWAE